MKAPSGPWICVGRFGCRVAAASSSKFVLRLFVLVASVAILTAQSGGLQEPVQPVSVILDDDMSHNADDTGDHAMLWAMAARGEANVLAMIIDSTNDYSAPVARAIASYYGHPNVPIGANLESIPNDYAAYFSYYTQQVAARFRPAGDTRFNYPDALTVYRQTLANAPDHSVYIVSGGYYRPMMRLLQSGADSISPLTGMQLVSQKVVRLIIVAGSFPDSGTTDRGNMLIDPDSGSYVVANWPGQIVWIPDDIAWDVTTGPATNADPTTNPVAMSYQLYCNGGGAVPDRTYCNNNTPGWTQIGLLYGVRGGYGTTFVPGGINGSTVVWGSATTVPGRIVWSQTPNRNHSWLVKNIPGVTMASTINSLIQWIPPSGQITQPPVANSQSVTVGSPSAITLTASDPQNAALTYRIVTGPAHGVLSGTAPSLTYAPAAGYSGPDSFTFVANNTVYDSNTATVSITVIQNHPPTANSQSVTSYGAPIPIVLTATDADGDTLSYSVLTQPQHGTLSGTAPNLTYSATTGYAGGDSFSFAANDPYSTSNVATISITDTGNHPPVATSQSVTTTGSAIPVTLTATDADADALTYAVQAQAQHGTLTGAAPNLTYTPTSGYTGPDGFTFVAHDPYVASNVATVSITVGAVSAAVNIIFDSDIGHSVDDVGDHAMLWALSARGEVNVLALIVSSTNAYSVSCARAIAAFYGHPSVSIGANQGTIPSAYAATDSPFAQQCTNQFGIPGDNRANYPDAATVYRRTLAAASDNSVVIVNGGFYAPMADLLRSGPDAISPLTGPQLVTQKVRRAVLAAGRFPDSGTSPEGNLANDPDSASYVVANWPTEIVWADYNQGWNVITGPAPATDPATNPIAFNYNLACQNGTYCANSWPAWTQLGMLYAVRGLGTNFSFGGQNGSTVVWDSTTATPGRSIWSQTPDRQHGYLQRISSPTDAAAQLNALVQWIPPAAPVLNSLTLTPTTVNGGSSSSATVTLSAAAPAGGAEIGLGSSNTAVATVPPTVTVLGGATSATFSVTTTSVTTSTSVSISAAYGSTTLNASLTVQPGARTNQSITFAPLPGGTYGDPPFSVAASASSGLLVTFTAAGNCSISNGNLVTLTGAGSCSVTAHQGGDATYNPAPDVTQTFAIARAAATVQLGNLTATYDGTSKTVTATTTPNNLAVGITYNGSATAPVNAGSYAVVATIQDVNYQGSANGTLTINPATTSVALSSSANPSVFGQSVSFTAVVSGPGGPPTGTVTFYDGATTLGTGSLTNGAASFTTSALSVTTHTITAGYGGASNFQASTSPALSQVVNGVATATTLTSTPNPSTWAQSVTLTATVTASGSIPAGAVTFSDGATVLGSSQLNASGTATLAVNSLSVGSHSLTAAYAASGTWLGSTSAVRAQTVNSATTTTALTSSPAPSTFGQPVTLTATVSATNSVPAGTVTFRDGSTVLGSSPTSAGSATFVASTLAVGGHSLTAVFAPAANNWLGSTSGTRNQTVNREPSTTTVTSSLNPAAPGQAVTFTATVTTNVGVPSGTIQFRDGPASNVIGTATLDANGRASFTTSALAAGNHTIRAVYSGDTNVLNSTSAALTQNIAYLTTTTVTSSRNPSLFGQSVTFTIVVTAPSGIPRGPVVISDGAATLASLTLNSSGTATYTTSSLTRGAHSITAAYGGNTTNQRSTSAVLIQQVN
jgi:hypothetical protein